MPAIHRCPLLDVAAAAQPWSGWCSVCGSPGQLLGWEVALRALPPLEQLAQSRAIFGLVDQPQADQPVTQTPDSCRCLSRMSSGQRAQHAQQSGTLHLAHNSGGGDPQQLLAYNLATNATAIKATLPTTANGVVLARSASCRDSFLQRRVLCFSARDQ